MLCSHFQNPMPQSKQSIVVLSKRQKGELARLVALDYVPVDVTSKGPEEFKVLSPFYPVGGIPIEDGGQPVLEPGATSESVEGLWQGLKVFDNELVDPKKFRNRSMKQLKRGISKKRGRVQGHRGAAGLVPYKEARRRIYLPAYERQLRSAVAKVALERLRALPKLVLLDYGTNADVEDTRTPLSHAALVRRFLLEGSVA